MNDALRDFDAAVEAALEAGDDAKLVELLAHAERELAAAEAAEC